jgi:trk system potassium uptake protein TrkH
MTEKIQKTFRLPVVLAASLQNQITIAIGLTFCIFISYFYVIINDVRFPRENPSPLWVGLFLSLFFFFLGSFFNNPNYKISQINIKQGTQIVILTWIFATFTSALVFFLAGFPIPGKELDFTVFRRFVDSIYESISGYTTAGGSILPSVETFSRGILMWRSTTHLIGGMGIAYIALTVIKNVVAKRSDIINSEAESPNNSNFQSEEDARTTGFEFMKIYGILTGIMLFLLLISGMFFRLEKYENWYDNVFDSVNYSFSTMGTGGFGVYDTSVGLTTTNSEGNLIIGGIKNPVSEWIIAIFMMIAGSNLGLFYILFFDKKLARKIFTNNELWAYIILILGLTLAIWSILVANKEYANDWDSLRYSFFNVTSIFSTTGLANANFHIWPASATAILFIAYLMGGMVGSTAGGLKTIRFLILFKYTWMKIQNLVNGRHKTRFEIDGVNYHERQVGLVIVNIVIYYLIFLLGAVSIVILSPKVTFADGSIKDIDLMSAITASIANLGNIGPTTVISSVDSGPAGNYFAYTESAKLVMSLLMLVGRIGVLTFLMLFISRSGMNRIQDSMIQDDFDLDETTILKL